MSTDRSAAAAAIADAVDRLPSVSRLYGGRLAEIATYGAAQRVPGVRFRRPDPDGTGAEEVEVHIVVAPGYSPLAAADAVHAEVQPLAGGRPVAVFVDDIDVDGPLAARPALSPANAGALPPGESRDI
jgi:hypothetical protein